CLVGTRGPLRRNHLLGTDRPLGAYHRVISVYGGSMTTAFNRMSNRAIKQFAARRLARELRYDPVHTPLVLVGVQTELLTDSDALAAIGRLLSAARASGLRTYYSPVERATPEHGIAYPTPSQSKLLPLLTATTGVDPRLTPAAEDVVLPPTTRLS